MSELRKLAKEALEWLEYFGGDMEEKGKPNSKGRDVIKYLKEDLAQPEWISVKDNLPKIDQLVLAHGKNIGCSTTHDDKSLATWDGQWWLESGTECAGADQEVTHWQPITNP